LKRPASIVVLQCIVLLSLIISIRLHKIIFVYEYFKDHADTFTAYGLAVLQFILILLFGFLFIGLWKRKAFARWGSVLFFVIIIFAYNVFVVLLGSGPVHIVKFIIVHGVSLFFIYQLSFSNTLAKFFR
jgi:hypothetical protein